jgi:DNA modification methylase
VARLCAAGLANLVFTDPPYNVDYESYTDEKLKIEGSRSVQAFLEASFAP